MHPVPFRNPFLGTSQAPSVVVVIPARYASSRFPGKPLADLGGRPMIEHVYRRAAAVRGVEAVVVATDDERVVEAVQRFGGIARMTDASHRTGMDRIAEVAHDLDCRVVVNVQGDEPLVDPSAIAQMIAALDARNAPDMSTLRTPIIRVEDYLSPHVVKVVVDANGDALYFSRASIPYHRDAGPAEAGHYVAHKHLGLYAYRRAFLLRLAALPQTRLEQAESLEQLRAVEHGYRIRAVETEYDSIGVDTPEDLERVRLVEARMREGVAATRA